MKIDQDTVDQFRAGDDEAFSRIFRAASRSLFGTAVRVLGDRGLSEDVVQEAFLRLYGMRSRLDPGKSIEALLVRITVNLAIDTLRQRKRERWKSFNADPVEPGDAVPAIDSRMTTVESINRAAAALPPISRTILALRYGHEMTYEEIAGVLRISMPAVALRLKRAKEQLREALAKQEREQP